MDLAGLLVFAAAYLVATATPGPGVAAVVARTLARGPAGSAGFIAGFVLGDLIWFAVAASGLPLLAESFEALFIAIRYAGAAYLLFLAWKLWTVPADVPGAQSARLETGTRLFLAGLGITLGNPKVIVFFLALLPTVLDLSALTPGGFAAVALLGATILSSVLAAYTLAAARARRLLTSPRAVRAVNRGSGAAMAAPPWPWRRADRAGPYPSSCPAIQSLSAPLGMAPTLVSSSLPSLNSSMVGMPRTAYSFGVIGLSSMFTLATVSLPA